MQCESLDRKRIDRKYDTIDKYYDVYTDIFTVYEYIYTKTVALTFLGIATELSLEPIYFCDIIHRPN